jgi:hypothetical protein
MMQQQYSVSQPQTPRAVSVGLSGVGQAFWRALVSQLHPRMLFALLLPFFIMLIGAILLLIFALSPLTQWINQMLNETSALITANAWLASMGLFSLDAVNTWLVGFIVLMMLLPISGILGLTVAAIFVMPIVVTHVSRQHFPGLVLQGQHAFVVSVWNAVWVSVVFVLGWILTLPFWLFPPLGLLVSLLWWTFAFSRIMRIDAIVEHATAQERSLLIARHGTGFWTIGMCCALMNLVPPAWIFLPVFSGLIYTHYGLDALQRLRAEKTLDI